MKKYFALSAAIAFLLISSISTITKATPFKPSEKLNVWLIDGVQLKVNPAEDSKTITTIAYGTSLNVIKLKSAAKTSTIDFKSNAFKTPYKLSGKWVKVEFNGKQGYVFGGYLSAMPVLRQDKQGHIETADEYLKRNFGVLKIEKKTPKKGAQASTIYYKNGAESTEAKFDGCIDDTLYLKNITLNEAVLFQKALYKEADAAQNEKIEQQKNGAVKISSYSCD